MTDDLAEAINDSVDSMAAKAYDLIESERYEDSVSLLNEWTTPSGKCILTHHYTNTIEEITDLQTYMFNENGQFGYGTYSYDPDAELPIDNN